jgi:hypothetical protein
MTTQCSVPSHLQILQEKHGLPTPDSVQVAVIHSKASKGLPAVDAVYEQALRTLMRV